MRRSYHFFVAFLVFLGDALGLFSERKWSHDDHMMGLGWRNGIYVHANWLSGCICQPRGKRVWPVGCVLYTHTHTLDLSPLHLGPCPHVDRHLDPCTTHHCLKDMVETIYIVHIYPVQLITIYNLYLTKSRLHITHVLCSFLYFPTNYRSNYLKDANVVLHLLGIAPSGSHW